MNSKLTRLKNLQKETCDALLISSIPNIIYLTHFVSFSKEEREAYLLITKNKKYILTDGRYTEAVRSNVKDFELIEISSKFSMEDALKTLAKKH